MKRSCAIVLMILAISVNTLFARPKIGLVLSGGGAKGLAHIGMLKVIEETGLPIDCIVGTSMGAIIGGLYAMGYSADEIEQAIKDMNWDKLLDNNVPREDIYVGEKRWKPMSNYYFNLDQSLKPSIPQGFITGNSIHLEMFRLTWKNAHIRDFNQFKIPFRCVGTSLLSGKMVVFDEGSLADALRASSSLPSIFMPFEYENDLIIDGGISQNLPIEIAKSMGMDIVIALKTNSKLSDQEGLKNAISVLNQTINIGMTRNMESSLGLADIVISPAVDYYSAADFNKAKDIITIGEIEASRYFSVFDSLSNKIKSEYNDEGISKPVDILPDTLSFKWIFVENNKHLHASKVREYVNLNPNKTYHRDEILNAFYEAWASELFDQIYPRISRVDDYYTLTIVVNEKERRRLGINLTYNNYNGMIIGSVLDFNNLIQKNSKLLINTQLGGRHAFDLDYVKNFGKHYGIYFRLFPYVKEDNIYLFNEDHEKTMSLKYLEYGGNFGMGFYSYKNNILEPFLYHYHINVYKDIADTEIEKKNIFSSGYGFKLYHEEINDMVFPTKGKKFLLKFTSAEINRFNNFKYRKLLVKDEAYGQFSDNFTLIWKGEYGTYFESDPVKVDQFNIGGIDSFLGCNPLEIRTSFYRTARIGIRLNFSNKYYTDWIYDYATWGDADKWLTMDNKKSAKALILGAKTMFGPIRTALALDENNHFFYYLSVGFDYDAFEFSRR